MVSNMETTTRNIFRASNTSRTFSLETPAREGAIDAIAMELISELDLTGDVRVRGVPGRTSWTIFVGKEMVGRVEMVRVEVAA